MVEAIAGETDIGIGLWISIATLIVESIIVILLYRTVRDYAEVAKLSRVEVKQRFRPWIGPSTGIEFMHSKEGKEQYAIAIKNFGEIAATNVVAMSTEGNEMPSSRDLLISSSESPHTGSKIDKSTLGPLLPNMEKRYWLFLDSALMQEVREGNGQLFTTVYFSYEFSGGKAGYGMTSQFDIRTGTFIHKDMWVD